MADAQTWNPFTEWRHTEIDWIRVKIKREDLARFTKRSDAKGLAYAVSFFLLIALTGALTYLAFARRQWILMALGLYIHGSFYAFFGAAIHELSHSTVFASKWLNGFFTSFFGWLYWPMNPFLYRASHQKYHHLYTLHEGSDGEDVPTYMEITPRFVIDIFFRFIKVKSLIQNLYRLFTLTPASKGWRGRAAKPDLWEQFIFKNASEKERLKIRRQSWLSLVGHVLFVAICVAAGAWFLPILVTLAPFYGASFMTFMVGIHQHAACESNEPDFRISCGDTIPNPLLSFLYWKMEHHIEHHMFAAIPCYNLKPFSQFVADQLPPKVRVIPRLLYLHKKCKEKYGSYDVWREKHGVYKGF